VSGRVAGRKEPNRWEAYRYEKRLKKSTEARQTGIGHGQPVDEEAKTTGNGALRVGQGAKLVGNVTLRVSKGDRPIEGLMQHSITPTLHLSIPHWLILPLFLLNMRVICAPSTGE
jgi:hypothetical protein